MHERRFLALAILPALILAAASVASGQVAYDVYKQTQDNPAQLIPDVDKTIPPPPPPNPGVDNSCWMATAANILGAAGYGQGPNAQARATGIYQQLALDLGWWNTGAYENAINYWLYQYGKNPNAGTDFNPVNTYTDVTFKYGAIPLINYTPPPAQNVGYNFLLDELKRCQYVGIQLSGTPDHCVTLVGGNYWNHLTLNAAIIHDSDFDVGNGPNTPDDDVYANIPDAFSNWQLQYNPLGGAGQLRPVTGWVTLCPGLNKPALAVSNYDVAWFKSDPNKDGDWTNEFRVAGSANYGQPQWEDSTTLYLPNEEIPLLHKEISLLVDYVDRVPNRESTELLQLQYLDQNQQLVQIAPTSIQASADDGQLLFTWVLEYQPPWEKIIFPDDKYNLLNEDVKDWNVATVCIPEPSLVTLMLATAMLAAVRRRRR